MMNTEGLLIEQLIEQKEQKLKESKEMVRKRLENDLNPPSNLDKTIYNDIKFFLSLGDTDVDLDFIVFCICDNGFLEDFCLYRCNHTFIPYIGMFNVLVQSLRDIYINC